MRRACVEETEIFFRRPAGSASRNCRQIHLPQPHFHVYRHSTDHTVHWLKTSCAPKNIPSSSRHVSSFAARDTEHFLTFSLSSTSPVLLSSSSPNRCPRVQFSTEHPRQDGTSTEFHSSRGHEPKRIELSRILVKPQNQCFDGQDDIEEIGVKQLSCSQS